ncbi:MAG: hypothetical protein ACRELF_07320 [Gemmataceae bacterium]
MIRSCCFAATPGETSWPVAVLPKLPTIGELVDAAMKAIKGGRGAV